MPHAIDPHHHDYYYCLLEKLTLKGMKLRWPWTHEEDSEGRQRNLSPQSLEQKCSLLGGGIAFRSVQICTYRCNGVPVTSSFQGECARLMVYLRMPRESSQSGAPQSSCSLAAILPKCQIPKLTSQRRLHNKLLRHFSTWILFNLTCCTECDVASLAKVMHTLEKSALFRVNSQAGVKEKVKSLSRVRLFVTPWTVAYQASPSMGFSRQEYWSGLPLPSPEDLPDPGIEPGSSTL